jgi:hypothetical protein
MNQGCSAVLKNKNQACPVFYLFSVRSIKPPFRIFIGSSKKIVVISAISGHEHPDLFSTKGALV